MTSLLMRCWWAVMLVVTPTFGQQLNNVVTQRNHAISLQDLRETANYYPVRNFGGTQAWSTAPVLNWGNMARAAGLSEEVSELVQEMSEGDREKRGGKPHVILLRHVLNAGIDQLPYLPKVREHLPKKMRINVDLEQQGFMVEVKIWFPNDW